MLKIPIGTKVKVTPDTFTSLSTPSPVVRVAYQSGNWVALDKAVKKGLIVFVCHPQEMLANINELQITSVSRNVAFAINSSLTRKSQNEKSN